MDANGQITVAPNAVLDFETLPTYTLDLNVSDSKDADGNSDSEVDDTITITINLTDVPPPPQMEQPEFSASGTADTTSMLLLKWDVPVLPDGTPSISGYEVQFRVNGETDWIDHDFDSVATTTETTITGLASNTHYEAQVRAVNVEGSGGWSPTASAKTAEARLTVAFSSATYTVREGESATTTVTVMPTADRDITVTVTMTGTGATLSGLTNGMLTIERGANSGSFAIAGDEDDDATDDEVTLTLDADQDSYVFPGSPSTTTVTIVDDEEPNTPPVVATTSPVTVNENQTAVATLEATDPDNHSITGWSISSGPDSALFNLNNSGVLSFKTAPDYENPNDAGRDNGYEVKVTASDGTDDSAPMTIIVNVIDVNEPPGAPTGLSILPNQDYPALSLDVSWTAPDTTGIPAITGYDVQYYAGNSEAWITHDFNSDGTTTGTTIPHLASNTTYQVQARAKNDEGEGQWATSSGTTATPEPTNNPPVVTTTSPITVQENQTTVATLEATDSDDDPITRWSIFGGADHALFNLNNDGELSFKSAPDYENPTDVRADNSYEVEVTASDGTDDSTPMTLTVNVTNVNEPPTFSEGTPTVRTIAENSIGGTQVGGSFTADDPEDDTLVYELSGTGHEQFDIDSNGQITVASNAVPDFETQHTYTLELDVSDSRDADGNSDPEVDDTITIVINLTDVPVPPQMKLPEFSASGTDDTSSMLILIWVAPTLPEGTASITGYDVQYRAQGESDWIVHNFDSDARETTITDLASNTYYDAQIRAVNVEGSGGWSPTSIAKTAEARLTVAFSATTYTVGEGKEATITVTVTPTADRNVTVAVSMAGTGATLSGLD